MDAEFRARMVGRTAILITCSDGRPEYVRLRIRQTGADAAVAWVKERYPRVALRFRQFEPFGAYNAVIDFRSDQSATDFRHRWV